MHLADLSAVPINIKKKNLAKTYIFRILFPRYRNSVSCKKHQPFSLINFKSQNYTMWFHEVIDGLNQRVEDSYIGSYFQFKDRNACFTKELKGAFTSFLAMAYILAVNPRILADSGGPCVPPEDGDIFSPEYEDCMLEIRKQYVTATAIASMVGCFLMGLMANLPIALSCGMGINAYFTYSVVGWRGTGEVSFQAALTAILIEGAIFVILAITGTRFFIVKLIPEPVRIATSAGIGAFLAHLGFQTAEGLGLVVGDVATGITLGACPPENRIPMVAYDDDCKNLGICVISDNYTCDVKGGIMTSGRSWLGLLGLLITATMLSYRKKGAFILGIAIVTFISWFRNTAVTYFPDTETGDASFDYFSKVVSIEPLDDLFAQYTGNLRHIAIALITFLYVDFLDTSGTLFALVTSLGYADNETGDFPKSRWAFTADGLATAFGSLLGLSPVTAYIESAAGVETGARTGLTAVFCGIFFFLSIFFAPIIASIPPWATGGTLIMVGALMCRSLKDIKWWDPVHALSAFLTVMLMPLTYSIAYGIIGGMLFWFSMQTIFKVLDLLGVKRKEIIANVNPVTKLVKGQLDDDEEEEEVEVDTGNNDKLDTSPPAEAPVEEGGKEECVEP